MTPDKSRGRAVGRRGILLALVVLGGLSVLILLAGCSSQPSAEDHEPPRLGPPPRFGDRMDGIGRRLERLGRAAEAGRWELARYEVEELEETFEDVERTPRPEDLESFDDFDDEDEDR